MNRVALIVDDDPLVLQIIADMLAELGCEVIVRQDATEALAIFEQDQRIEILVADINMPRIAGSRTRQASEAAAAARNANTDIRA